jgi:hypothetical protein
MPSGSAPKSPDYVGAAKEQGIANVLAALQTAVANNPDVNNPYGDQTVTWEDVPGTKAQPATKGHFVGKGKNKKWVAATKAVAATPATKKPKITQTLKPEQKALLDKSNAAKINIGDTSVQTSKNLQDTLAQKLDFSGAPRMPSNSGQARTDVINAMMSRVNTDYKQQNDQTNSDLIAAGIRPGTAAYETAMDRNARGMNDARQAAILAGGQEASRDYGLDMQSHQQGISDIMQQRQAPLNEFNALQSGSQVSSPFSGGLGFQGGANFQAAPTFAGVQAQGQAQQNQYNQQQAQTNGNISAGAGLIGSLGSAALNR